MAVIKVSHPTNKKVYLGSDEVGCYNNSSLLATLRDVGSRQGTEVVRYDFQNYRTVRIFATGFYVR